MTHLARRNSPLVQVEASAQHLHGQGTSGATNVVLQATTGPATPGPATPGSSTPGLDDEQVTEGQHSPDQGPSGGSSKPPVFQGTPGQATLGQADHVKATTEQAPQVQATVEAPVQAPVQTPVKAPVQATDVQVNAEQAPPTTQVCTFVQVECYLIDFILGEQLC